jgi:hypothetical protein
MKTEEQIKGKILNSILMHYYLKSISGSGEENIEPPNDNVLNTAYGLLIRLFEFNVFPDKITPSIEKGLLLIFKNENQKLYIELYNDGDIGYLIEDIQLKKILENVDINDIDKLLDRIINFVNL